MDPKAVKIIGKGILIATVMILVLTGLSLMPAAAEKSRYLTVCSWLFCLYLMVIGIYLIRQPQLRAKKT